MGKLSRTKVLGTTEDERKEKGFGAWKERMSASIHASIDLKKDQIAAQTAIRLRSDKRILQRWMDYCGVSDPSEIDYSDPCVHIEWVCCETDMLMLATEDGEKFLAMTGCDRDVFMKYFDQSAAKP